MERNVARGKGDREGGSWNMKREREREREREVDKRKKVKRKKVLPKHTLYFTGVSKLNCHLSNLCEKQFIGWEKNYDKK